MDIRYKYKYIIRFVLILGVLLFLSPSSAVAVNKSTRQERKAILSGNKLYEQKKYAEALKCYDEAIKKNSSSATATYNMGVCYLQMGAQKGDTTKTKAYLQKGMQYMGAIAQNAASNPGLASRANYNMGNITFSQQDFAGAINYYKQALRLNPQDNQARRNLRIAQLKLQNQNKDNKDKNNNQDKQKDQNKDKDKNQDKNQNKQQENNKPQQPQNAIDKQTANQILQAVENKENQTRARLNLGNGKNGRNNAMSVRNW